MKYLLAALPLAFATGAVAQDAFDYIVAGAGAAGIVVAERLAESGKQVLLIERGRQSSFASGGQWIPSWNNSVTYYDVPGLCQLVYSSSGDDPQGSPFCPDTADTAGCLLGGGTTVNMMAFIKPQDADFERWPASWQAPAMASAKSKLYSRIPGTTVPAADGKLYDQPAFNMVKGFFDNVGWSEVNMQTQVNAKTNTYSHSSSSVAGGMRQNPVSAYLPLAQARPNFHMMLNTKVIKVVRDGPKVTGVVIEKAGARSTIKLKPNGKAILASGTLSTPRVLWYSGIGRTPTLQAIVDGAINVQLPPKADWINLPVGYSLRNHAQVRVRLNTRRNMEFVGIEQYQNPSQQNVNLYNTKGSGIFALNNMRINYWGTETLNGRVRWFQGDSRAVGNNVIEMHIILAHGETSTGQLGIDPNTGRTTFVKAPTLNTGGDKQAFAKFLNRILGYADKPGSTLVYNGRTAKELLATAVDESNRGGAGVSLVDKATAGLHYLGTCKMGTDDGRRGGTAVVDPNTKVYGTDNLFVVDGSIHPDLSTGNTQAIIMVAAERAAEKILALG